MPFLILVGVFGFFTSDEINHPIFFQNHENSNVFLVYEYFLKVLNHSQLIIFQFLKPKEHKFGDFFKVKCYRTELISENLAYTNHYPI